MSVFAETIYRQKYAQPGEEWPDTARRVASSVMGDYFSREIVDEATKLITERKFMPGGRYLYAAGKEFHQTQNCLLLSVEDSRESWADLMQKVTSGLMTGAGVGVVYSALRGRGEPVKGMGGTSTGPTALMQMVNEAGRHIMQGGSRRSAIWAGLHWNHADVFEFITMKNWSDDVKALKERDFNFPASMDMTNISVILDDAFFSAYDDATDPMHDWAHRVYDQVINQMLTTAEPGFSVDVGVNAGEHLRNACTEITSHDDSDICNLGSINLAALDTIEEMERAVHISTLFLLAGTLYSRVPYQKVADVRSKNRRLGLGLMGIYEWLAVRGKVFGPDAELGQWLQVYETSGVIANAAADELGISRPVKTRAIAPTGTIGILAETTTGMEPMLAAAYKRRYLRGSVWHYQYVVDATARRLLDKGVPAERLEDAYDLAAEPTRRLEMQAWLQGYVDHGISSTINLPSPDQQSFTPEEFGKILMAYLPSLRGVTVYPDGARGGQPLSKVPLVEALEWEGLEIEEVGNSQACVSGACGV
jgi:ribonucleoside-diphosphate reductase alpha chain